MNLYEQKDLRNIAFLRKLRFPFPFSFFLKLCVARGWYLAAVFFGRNLSTRLMSFFLSLLDSKLMFP